MSAPTAQIEMWADVVVAALIRGFLENPGIDLVAILRQHGGDERDAGALIHRLLHRETELRDRTPLPPLDRVLQ